MSKLLLILREKFKFLRSIRTLLFVLCFSVGLIPCVILSNTLLNNYEKKAVGIRTSDVSNQLRIISDHLITYNYLQGGGADVIDAELSQLSNLYDGRILIINSDLKIIEDTYGMSQGKTIVSSEVVRALKGETINTYDSDTGYIEIATPIVSEKSSASTTSNADGSEISELQDKIPGVMLTSVSTSTIINTQETLGRTSKLVILIASILLLVTSFHISHVITKPFIRLTRAISDMKEGYSSDEVMVEDYLETERISDAFNQVYSRMKLLDDSRQEFVSNVSHELKTPITSVKVLADSLLMQEDAPAELYKEFLEDITKEIDRENKIISDLLSLAKMDKKAAELSIKQVDINELIEFVLKRLRPIAMEMDVELTFESYKEVIAAVDEIKISQVITNLVENAIKYNVEHGWVKVCLDADHQFFTVIVEDSGIGISEDNINHIFERFYRVDKSHSREIGGTGLGLAITRSAVLMHRGAIKVDSKVGEGTKFTVRMPLTYFAG